MCFIIYYSIRFVKRISISEGVLYFSPKVREVEYVTIYYLLGYFKLSKSRYISLYYSYRVLSLK
jgi:hypothetical protein